MNDYEKDVLARASRTIKNLQQTNRILSAQVDTFNKCMRMVESPPAYHGGSSLAAEVDVSWELDSLLQAQDKAQAERAEVSQREAQQGRNYPSEDVNIGGQSERLFNKTR